MLLASIGVARIEGIHVMTSENASIIKQVEETWTYGEAIVAKRVNEQLAKQGVTRFIDVVDSPEGITLERLYTRFRRLWDKLEVDWDLPEVEKYKFCPWIIGPHYIESERDGLRYPSGHHITREKDMEYIFTEPGLLSQTANYWTVNILNAFLDHRREWKEFFANLKREQGVQLSVTELSGAPERSQEIEELTALINTTGFFAEKETTLIERLIDTPDHRISKAAINIALEWEFNLNTKAGKDEFKNNISPLLNKINKKLIGKKCPAQIRRSRTDGTIYLSKEITQHTTALVDAQRQ